MFKGENIPKTTDNRRIIAASSVKGKIISMKQAVMSHKQKHFGKHIGNTLNLLGVSGPFFRRLEKIQQDINRDFLSGHNIYSENESGEYVSDWSVTSDFYEYIRFGPDRIGITVYKEKDQAVKISIVSADRRMKNMTDLFELIGLNQSDSLTVTMGSKYNPHRIIWQGGGYLAQEFMDADRQKNQTLPSATVKRVDNFDELSKLQILSKEIIQRNRSGVRASPLVIKADNSREKTPPQVTKFDHDIQKMSLDVIIKPNIRLPKPMSVASAVSRYESLFHRSMEVQQYFSMLHEGEIQGLIRSNLISMQNINAKI